MAGLSARDAERLLRFVADAERIGGDQLFTPELLVELGQLVRADSVSYSELDRVRRREIFYAVRPGDEDEDDDFDRDLFWNVVIEEHPICLAQQLGDFSATKLSDFASPTELRQRRIYEIWFGHWGIEHELEVAIPSPMWHTKTLMFDRANGRDFTERDRLVLSLLQPHLARLWQTAKTRRLLRAALAELDRADEHDARGVVLLGVAGEAEFVSPPAQRLLRTFFPAATGGLLPAPLTEWLEADARQPLIREIDGRRLTVRRAGEALVLEEKGEGIHLTAREREVVSWVARGKTNAEIGELLWLAPSTVRKHLENVYAKLGVNTRTAAVARFLGLIEAENTASTAG